MDSDRLYGPDRARLLHDDFGWKSWDHFFSVPNSRVSWALLLTRLVKLLTKRVFLSAHETSFHETSFLLLLTKRVFTKRVFCCCSRNEFSRNEFFFAAHETSFHETSFFLLLTKRVFTKRVFFCCSRNEFELVSCSRNEFELVRKSRYSVVTKEFNLILKYLAYRCFVVYFWV